MHPPIITIVRQNKARGQQKDPRARCIVCDVRCAAQVTERKQFGGGGAGGQLKCPAPASLRASCASSILAAVSSPIISLRRALGERDNAIDRGGTPLKEVEQLGGRSLNRSVAAIGGNSIFPGSSRVLGFLLARVGSGGMPARSAVIEQFLLRQ